MSALASLTPLPSAQDQIYGFLEEPNEKVLLLACPTNSKIKVQATSDLLLATMRLMNQFLDLTAQDYNYHLHLVYKISQVSCQRLSANMNPTQYNLISFLGEWVPNYNKPVRIQEAIDFCLYAKPDPWKLVFIFSYYELKSLTPIIYKSFEKQQVRIVGVN